MELMTEQERGTLWVMRKNIGKGQWMSTSLSYFTPWLWISWTSSSDVSLDTCCTSGGYVPSSLRSNTSSGPGSGHLTPRLLRLPPWIVCLLVPSDLWQLIQNAAARLPFNLPKFSHTTPLLRSLHWLPVTARIHFKTLVLVYGSGPVYIEYMVKNHDCLLSWLPKAPHWHQDSRKSTHLLPQAKSTSLQTTPWLRRWCPYNQKVKITFIWHLHVWLFLKLMCSHYSCCSGFVPSWLNALIGSRFG